MSYKAIITRESDRPLYVDLTSQEYKSTITKMAKLGFRLSTALVYEKTAIIYIKGRKKSEELTEKLTEELSKWGKVDYRSSV